MKRQRYAIKMTEKQAYSIIDALDELASRCYEFDRKSEQLDLLGKLIQVQLRAAIATQEAK